MTDTKDDKVKGWKNMGIIIYVNKEKYMYFKS